MKKSLFTAVAAFVLVAAVLCTYLFVLKSDKENEQTVDTIESRAAEIVSGMTTRQKVGQMIMPAFRKWNDGTLEEAANVTELNDEIRGAIEKYGFGGIILFRENIVGTEQTVRLTDDLQKTAVSESSLSKLPLLIATDQEGGYVYRLTTGTTLCGNMALGATGDSSNATRAGGIIADELNALGINIGFAPSVDVNSNPSNPVIGVRSFSSDPKIVAEMGCAYLEGISTSRVAAAVKHFPGHGDTATDSHTGLPCVDKSYDEIKETQFAPFAAAVEKNVDIVMTAHIQFPQIETGSYTSILDGGEVNLPATLSKTIITDILRGDMGYDGVVSTDSLGMDAIAANFKPADTARLAINAGVDLLLMPVEMTASDGIAKMGEYIDAIVAMVEKGEISEERITESAERIIRLKLKKGVLEQPDTELETKVANAKATVGSEAHHDAGWEITKKAVTLIKNEGGLLPLKSAAGEKTIVFCPSANDINCVKYAYEKLAADGLYSADAGYEIVGFEGGEGIDAFAETIAAGKNFIVLSETYGNAYLDPAEEKGKKSGFIDELIEKVHSEGKKITVISAHLPYDTARFSSADAILAAYCAKGMPTYPTEYNGETVTFGVNISAAIYSAYSKTVPTGKLPVTVMKIDDEYKYTDDILYPLGYHLEEWSK